MQISHRALDLVTSTIDPCHRTGSLLSKVLPERLTRTDEQVNSLRPIAKTLNTITVGAGNPTEAKLRATPTVLRTRHLIGSGRLVTLLFGLSRL